jgi:hypothetical protein
MSNLSEVKAEKFTMSTRRSKIQHIYRPRITSLFAVQPFITHRGRRYHMGTISSRGLRLSGETKARAFCVENDILALEEDITEDGEANARVALNTTEAAGATSRDRSVLDVLSRNNGIVATNGHGEVRQIGVAREDIATSRVVVLGAVNLLVVVRDNAVIEQEECSSSVYNSRYQSCETRHGFPHKERCNSPAMPSIEGPAEPVPTL